MNSTNQQTQPQTFLSKKIRATCIAIVPIAFYAGMTFAQVSPATAPTAGMPSATMHKDMHVMKADKGSAAMHKAMMNGMDMMQKMPMTGDADHDFAVMMRAHHQQGVDMAEMQIANGKSLEMKKMAKNIITAQKIEIAQFDKWLAKQPAR
jgi:uncharacterized protein (DUF305 family)